MVNSLFLKRLAQIAYPSAHAKVSVENPLPDVARKPASLKIVGCLYFDTCTIRIKSQLQSSLSHQCIQTDCNVVWHCILHGLIPRSSAMRNSRCVWNLLEKSQFGQFVSFLNCDRYNGDCCFPWHVICDWWFRAVGSGSGASRACSIMKCVRWRMVRIRNDSARRGYLCVVARSQQVSHIVRHVKMFFGFLGAPRLPGGAVTVRDILINTQLT